VEHAWLHRGQVIFKLSGVKSISEAERLVGADICIPIEERPVPADGEYFQSDLVGCEVVDAGGKRLGTVQTWHEYGGTPLLGVETSAGKELLIPFAKAICTSIDIATRRIVVELPEGLAELD
jgi:16S rRNA processing protein RimM